MNPISRRATESQKKLAIGQGVFFAASGLWPVFHLRSFEAVTGPKADGWLVKTVGLMIANIGGALLLGGLRGRVSPELRSLAVGSAVSLAAIDVFYAAGKKRISKIYLLDALVQAGLAAAWTAAEKTNADVGNRLSVLAGGATASAY